MTNQGLSFIENFEEDEAKALIEKDLGFAPPRPCGYHMAVKIFIRDEELMPLTDESGNLILDAFGKPKSLIIPSATLARDKWISCTALVVAQGPYCYVGERFKHSGPWCKVGDWIIIPRNEGVQINYRGIPMQIIPDDRVLGIIEDPNYVTRD